MIIFAEKYRILLHRIFQLSTPLLGEEPDERATASFDAEAHQASVPAGLREDDSLATEVEAAEAEEEDLAARLEELIPYLKDTMQ